MPLNRVDIGVITVGTLIPYRDIHYTAYFNCIPLYVLLSNCKLKNILKPYHHLGNHSLSLPNISLGLTFVSFVYTGPCVPTWSG